MVTGDVANPRDTGAARRRAAATSPAAKRLDAQRQIGARVAREDVALLEQRRDVGGESAQTQASAFDEEMADARMDAEFVDRAAMRRRGVVLHGAKIAKDPASLGEGAGLRRRDPGERGVGLAPDREVEGEGQKVGVHDLGRAGCGERPLRRLGPEPEGGARAQPSRSAGALIRVVARDADGVEPRQAEAGVESRHPRETAVDDDRRRLRW